MHPLIQYLIGLAIAMSALTLTLPAYGQLVDEQKIDRGKEYTVTGQAVIGNESISAAGADIYLVPFDSARLTNNLLAPYESVAKANAEGRFTLTVPRKGSFIVIAIHPEASSLLPSQDSTDLQTVLFSDKRPPEHLTLVLQKTYALTVTASNSEGQPVANAEIGCGILPLTLAKTDENGRAKLALPKGNFPIIIEPPIDFAVGLHTLSVYPGSTNETSVQVEAAGIVRGSVTDSQKQPVANATIGFHTGSSTQRRLTDQNGRFVLDRAPLGKPISLTVTGERFEDWSKKITVPAISGVLDLSPRLQPKVMRNVIVRLIDQAGEPFADTKVSARFRTNERGEVTLPLEKQNPFLVSSASLEFQPRSIHAGDFQGPGPHDLILKEMKRIQISGIVLDQQRQPVRRVQIHGCHANGESFLTGDDGTFNLTCTFSELNEIHFQKKGYFLSSMRLSSWDQTDLEIILRPMEPLRFQLVNGITEEPIRTFQVQWEPANLAAEEDFSQLFNEYSCGPLPQWESIVVAPENDWIVGRDNYFPGATYHLTFKASGYGKVRFENIDVTNGIPSTFHLQPAGTYVLSGTIKDWIGRPITGANITVEYLEQTVTKSIFKRYMRSKDKLYRNVGQSDGSGKFLIELKEHQGPISVTVQKSGLVPSQQFFNKKDWQNQPSINLALMQAGAIEVDLDRDLFNFPIELTIRPPATSPEKFIRRTERMHVTDGVKRIESLFPGECDVLVSIYKPNAENQYLFRKRIVIKASETARLVHNKKSGPSVSGQVISAGSPLINEDLTLITNNGIAWLHTRTDSRGMYQFDGLFPDQTYTLVIGNLVDRPIQTNLSDLLGETKQHYVAVDKSDTALDIEVEPMAKVHGYIESQEGLLAKLQRTDKLERTLETTVEPDGYFEFKNVPFGTYRVNSESPWSGKTRIGENRLLQEDIEIIKPNVDLGNLKPKGTASFSLRFEWPNGVQESKTGPIRIKLMATHHQGINYTLEAFSFDRLDQTVFPNLPSGQYTMTLQTSLAVLPAFYEKTIVLQDQQAHEEIIPIEPLGYLAIHGMGSNLPKRMTMTHLETGLKRELVEGSIKRHLCTDQKIRDRDVNCHNQDDSKQRGLLAGEWEIRWLDPGGKQRKVQINIVPGQPMTLYKERNGFRTE